MPLIKDGAWYEDTWQILDDATPLKKGDVAVSLKRWQAEKDALMAYSKKAKVAVILQSDDNVDDLGDDCHHLAMVAVTLPIFRDGRAFSTARLLRERYGFKGELRARGHILQDQLLFLSRCGVDVVEVDERITLASWKQAMAELPYVYQRGFDRRETIMAMRAKQATSQSKGAKDGTS
ncbi:MAG: DUF934 domain-containing protein [Alphaproteobacteria bacterium GM202ARS2]|nr:DUF934 domain-containing protein [Alphaproteobacteria bacterium GM202ARS2]